MTDYLRHGPSVPAGPTVRRLNRLLDSPGVTVRSIARAADVHPATISRLSLGQSGLVSVGVAARIRPLTADECQRKIRTDRRPREDRTCDRPGCPVTFTVRVTSARRFCSQPCAHRTRLRGWTDAELLAALRRAHGRRRTPLSRPAYVEWREAHPDAPGSATIGLRFGSWTGALRTAGYDVAPGLGGAARAFTDRQILTAIRVARRAGAVSCEDYSRWARRRRGRPSGGTVRLRFGSWNAALDKALA